MLGSWCYCSWNRKDQAPSAKIKQATTWRKCSFGDVILTLSLTWMINWVMNACYSFHRQSTLMYLRIKVKIALWNGCEDCVVSNYMIGLTVFKILWNWYDVFFKPVMIFFLKKWSNHIKSIFVYSIFAYQIIPFWKGLERLENTQVIISS